MSTRCRGTLAYASLSPVHEVIALRKRVGCGAHGPDGLTIAMLRDCTHEQGKPELRRDRLANPCLGLMCVVAQLNSPQVTSTHKTRASQRLWPKQTGPQLSLAVWNPAYPKLAKAVQCIVQWTPRDSATCPFCGSTAQKSHQTRLWGCSMEHWSLRCPSLVISLSVS